MSLTTTNVDQRPLLDEVLGNRSGSTVRVSVPSLALQLLAQPAFSGSALASINLFRPSLAELQAETPELGQHGAVISTATDAGVYEYTATGWILRAPIPALLTESLAAMEAGEARDTAVAVAAALAGYTEPGYLARVEAGANAAEAWAQSPNPPDPEDDASASAKTWAGRSEQSAGAAGSAAAIAVANAAATAADRQQTGEDRASASASAATAGEARDQAEVARAVAVPAAMSAAEDAEATAADRVQTGEDRAAAAESAAAAVAARGGAEDAQVAAETARDEAVQAIEGIGNPVSYAAQEPTVAQQQVARANIGLMIGDPALDLLNAAVDHSNADWAAGIDEEAGLSSPKQVALAVGAQALGVGQDWVDTTSDMQVGTIYQNTSGRPIAVAFTTNSNVMQLHMSATGGAPWEIMPASANVGSLYAFAIIPNDFYYRVHRPSGSGVITLFKVLSQ